VKIKEPLIILYDSLCEEYKILEKNYVNNPTPQKRKIVNLLRSKIYEIDKVLQEM